MKIYEIVQYDAETETYNSFGLFKTREKAEDKLRELFCSPSEFDKTYCKREWTGEDGWVSHLGLSTTYYDLKERELME